MPQFKLLTTSNSQVSGYDFGESIDRSKYRRWHFCYYNEVFLIRTIGTTRFYLN